MAREANVAKDGQGDKVGQGQGSEDGQYGRGGQGGEDDQDDKDGHVG